MRFTVIIRNDDGYVATVRPAGCVSQGGSPAGLRNVKEAIEVYIESLLEDGIPLVQAKFIDGDESP